MVAGQLWPAPGYPAAHQRLLPSEPVFALFRYVSAVFLIACLVSHFDEVAFKKTAVQLGDCDARLMALNFNSSETFAPA